MLSRDWTLSSLFKLALTDLGLDLNDASWVQRFDLGNKMVSTVANSFYDLMSQAYMTPVTLVPQTVGRYYVSGASWTALTSRLTATMNSSFTAQDVESVIVFRVNASVFIAKISAFVSATVVVLQGHELPTTDQTVNDVLMVSTNPTSTTLSIADLRIMRTGQQIKIELESTATQTVEPVTSQAVYKFDATADQNANKIVYAYSGEELIFAKGNSLATFGTFTLRYPRVPYLFVVDTDKPDLPDGVPMQLGFLLLKKWLAERHDKQMPTYDQDMKLLVESMYRTFGQEVQVEKVKDKVLALK